MKVDVTIKGVSPLLMHRFPLAEAEGFEKWTDDQKAEWAAYREPSSDPAKPGELYIPSENLWRCLVSAASYSKGKRGASLGRTVAATLALSPAHLGLGIASYAVDIRTVTIRATQGRIPRVRPRLDEWEVRFIAEWDETLLTERQIREVTDNAGRRVGVLDYRPEKKGPFGRFMVSRWDV